MQTKKRKTNKKIYNIKHKINFDLVTSRRFLFFIFLVCLLFLIIFIRLYNVMIIDNNEYKKKLKDLSYDTVLGSSAPRGRIFDRNGNIIVDNKAIRTIIYKKSKKTTTGEMIDLAYLVSNHLDLNYNSITDRSKREFYLAKYPDKCSKLITKNEYKKVEMKKLSSNDIKELKIKRISDEELNKFNEEDLKAAYLYYLMNKGYAYDEKIIKTDVNDQEYAYISENNENLEGFNTKLDWERVYPYGDTFKSILGKVSTSEQGLPADSKNYYLKQGYSLNDRVGISYIEKEYENYLHGSKAVYKVVNSHELKLIKDGKRGNDIVLSIDINLQKEVENILSQEVLKAKNEVNTEYYDHSSVVIQDPNTGEILAMASKRVVNGEITDYTSSILTSPITPGSVVKGASMLVGYNTGAIKMGEYINDECITVAGTPQKCSFHTLGMINDITALAKSSNVYQFKTAIRVNGQEYRKGMRLNFNQKAFDTYRDMYHSFGLGVKTGIDLPVESVGYSSKDVAAGNLLDFVMGQYETYTPMQLSQYVSTIANGGDRLSPHLLKEVHKSTDEEGLGKLIYTKNKNVLNKIDTKPEYMNRVKEGFYAVMHSAGGYGVGYIDQSFDAAGKTGTSQSFLDTDNNGVIDTETITSSYIGYMPASSPKMSIMVTSPDSSRPNPNSDFTSLVTLHITKAITNKYHEMYGQ